MPPAPALRGAELRAWIASLPVHERDARVQAYLGLGDALPSSEPPGEHLVGYHPSGVDAILTAIDEAPVTAADVLIDLGSGLGKVTLLAHLLTGAAARGIELQPALVARARAAAARLGADAPRTAEAARHVAVPAALAPRFGPHGVGYTEADARDAPLDDGTVFFLYAPFTGPALAAVLLRLRAVAARRPIKVCALGIDLHRDAPWLAPRALDAFWLTIYDSLP